MVSRGGDPSRIFKTGDCVLNYLSVGMVVTCCFLAFSAEALTLPPIVEMGPAATKITVPVKNNSGVTATYRVAIDEVTFPDAHRKILVKNTQAIKFYPAQLTVAPKETVNLALTRAHGWANERYFSVRLTQSPAGRLLKPNGAAEIEYPVALSINLITRANNMHFAYHIDKQVFFNDGNSYVMLMRDGQCGLSIGDTYIVPPKKHMKLPIMQQQDLLRLGKFDELVEISNNCNKKSSFWDKLFG